MNADAGQATTQQSSDATRRQSVFGRALTSLAATAYGASSRDRLTILIFHRVVARPDELLPDLPCAARFRWQMELLRRHFRVLPLAEAATRLPARSLPAGSVCVTFDDGYADNATVALPVLLECNLSATFFVASGYLGEGCMWNDLVIEALRGCQQRELDLDAIGLGRHRLDDPAARRTAVDELLRAIKYLEPEARLRRAREIAASCGMNRPPRLMMTRQQVAELARAGMHIGGHTLSHPILRNLSIEEARREILGNREELESIIDQPVTTFAYPNGRPGTDYGPEHVSLVRELGFRAAVSTSWGTAGPDCDPLQLPRFTPWDATPARFALRLLQSRLFHRPQFV